MDDKDAKKRARREQEFLAQIHKHGGTGAPPEDVNLEDQQAVIAATKNGRCLLCGGTWGPLHLHIPKHYPHFTKPEGCKAYRTQHNIPGEVPLAATWYRDGVKRGRDAFLADEDRSAEYRANAALKASGPRPDNYGKAGHASGWNPSNWEIAKCICSGSKQVDTAAKLGGGDNHKLIGRRAASMDLAHEAPFVADCGQPFRNSHLYALRQSTGFDVTDFDSCVGLSEGRSGATRPGDSITNPEDAQAVIDWRDGVIADLLKASAAKHLGLRLDSTRVYSQERVLKTFLPAMPVLNDALVGTIGKIRVAAREPRTVAELGVWICEQATIEQSSGSSDQRWRVTLRYLAKREDWLKKNLARLQATDASDGELVREMIGHGAHHFTVQNALRESTPVIPRFDVRMLIKEFATKFARPKPSKGGAPKGSRPTTALRDEMAAISEILGRGQKEVAEDFCFSGKTAEERMNQTFDYFSHHRLDINRQKTELQGASSESLTERYTQIRNQLSVLLAS